MILLYFFTTFIMDIKIFEQTKQINEYQQEVWRARELASILEYREYRNFKPVIEKAKIACINSWYDIDEHFVDIHEPQKSRNQYWETEWQNLEDIKLSRYACYLIVQNADPSKEIVALWQTYFALQTRKQELYNQSMEDQQRIYLRKEMKTHNKSLASTADKAWVTNYANFTDAGYMWLYGWRRQSDIHKIKKLKKDEKILDHMSSEELAANLFRATQTESKIRREWIKWQNKASITHFEIGKKVRKTIQEIWGTMPEKLPAVENIKLTEKRVKAEEKKKLWKK